MKEFVKWQMKNDFYCYTQLNEQKDKREIFLTYFFRNRSE